MHRDHKLGLALGVLVLGFAAALCFPKQSDFDQRLLQLDNVAELDADIARLPVHAYTNADPVSAPAAEPEASRATVAAEPELVPGSVGAFDLATGPPSPIQVKTSSTPGTDIVTSDATHSPPVEIGTGNAAIAPDSAEPPLAQNYTVRPGDTLSSLAARFLGNHGRYLELFEANREILATPDDLQPGMVLIVPESAVETSSPDVKANVNALSAGKSGADSAARTPAQGDSNPAAPVTDEPPRRFQPAGQRPFLKTQPVSRETTLQLPTMNASAGASNVDEPTAARAGRTYKVRRGDTLEGIAVREYGDARAVAKLRAANPNVLRDPRRLKPGTTLTLPERQ